MTLNEGYGCRDWSVLLGLSYRLWIVRRDAHPKTTHRASTYSRVDEIAKVFFSQTQERCQRIWVSLKGRQQRNFQTTLTLPTEMNVVITLVSRLIRAPKDVEFGQRHGMPRDFQHEFLAFLEDHAASPNAYFELRDFSWRDWLGHAKGQLRRVWFTENWILRPSACSQHSCWSDVA